MPDFVLDSVGLSVFAEAGGGTDEGRCCCVEAPLVPDWISPLAAVSLFVKEDIAQPAQDVSFAGVPMRGALAPPAAVREGGGSTVSGMDCACFLIRARYISTVFVAWSRIILVEQLAKQTERT